MNQMIKKSIPSFITLCNLVLGFLAIVSGKLFLGCMLILICMLLDSLDGVLARRFKVQSLMGKELDSLSDMVSFGIAPAVLYVQFSYFDLWYTSLAAIPFVVGSAVRLAKYNIKESKSSFTGLATPFAALFMIGVLLGVHYQEQIFVDMMQSEFIFFSIPVLLMVLMNSKLEMFSFKSFGKSRMDNTLLVLSIASFILLLVLDFKIALPATVLVYIFLSVLQKILVR